MCFERAAPVRPFRWPKGGESFAGRYFCATTGGYIGYESWLEGPTDPPGWRCAGDGDRVAAVLAALARQPASASASASACSRLQAGPDRPAKPKRAARDKRVAARTRASGPSTPAPTAPPAAIGPDEPGGPSLWRAVNDYGIKIKRRTLRQPGPGRTAAPALRCHDL
ncbi:hypothetical protein GCM10009654_42610 [Streptomyces hebeiensis]|uniref:Uncharacterized protein n=1 Tax=Streptomyces hebeiensis TaxID=229486 RepID=A0ABP4FIT7_9ACTN